MNLSDMTPAQREEHKRFVRALYDRYYAKDKARETEKPPRKPRRKRAAK